MLDDLEFKKFVIEKLSSIDDRLAGLESGLDGLSNFAGGFSDQLNIDQDFLVNLKDSLASLSQPMTQAMASPSQDVASDDILASLNEFKDRISGIRSFMENQGLSEEKDSE
jgi:hypothetical protein